MPGRLSGARPLRVLLTADSVGGVWQYAIDLADGLARRGAEVTLATLGPRPSPAKRRAAEAVPDLTLLETDLPLDWTADSAETIRNAARALAQLAAERNVDVVHLNAPALAARVVFPAPVVAVHHSCVATWWAAVRGGALPDDFVWRTRLVAEGLRAADAIVAPTAAFAEDARRCYGAGLDFRVVPNGRRLAETMASGGKRDDFVFTAGRLWDEGKNAAVLDRAAPRITLPVRAAGPLESPNGARAAFKDLDCLGSLDDAAMAVLFARRPIFVSAALYEPFGLAVLEAAQAGCALVLADIPTFRELWDGAALFVPPRDEAALAAALDALAAEPARRTALGAAAKARAAHFTVEAMTDGVLAVYDAVLAARPALRQARASA